MVELSGLEVEVGEVCLIETGRDNPAGPAEVVGFRGSSTLLMPLGEMQDIAPGKTVTAIGEPLRIPTGMVCSGAWWMRSAVRSTEGSPPRLGIFASSGVGKSSLLGMIARHHD